MKSETRDYLRTSRPYLSVLVGGAIGAILGAVTNNWLGLLIGQFFGGLAAVLISKARGHVLSGILGSCSALLAVVFLILFAQGSGAITPGAVIAMIIGVVCVGFLSGLIVSYCRSSHTIRNVFHSPRFFIPPQSNCAALTRGSINA